MTQPQDPYTIHTDFRFEVEGFDEEIAIVSNDGTNMYVEETRNNGQEDTHMGGPLECVGGIWRWGDNGDGGKSFIEYGGRLMADRIVAHLNQYPPPRLPAPKPPTAEQIAALNKAVTYLDDATTIIEEDGGDEDDVTDAREVASEARAVLSQLTPAGSAASVVPRQDPPSA